MKPCLALNMCLSVAIASCGSEDGGHAGDPNPTDAAAAEVATDSDAPQGDAGDLLDTGPPACTVYARRGPFVVGVLTLDLGDREAEVWYPAKSGSEAGRPNAFYDVRDWLPEAEKVKIPADAPTQFAMDAYRDLPASENGPFPLVLYSHGMVSFRTQASFLMTHLASWGFVLAAPDHKERGLTAFLEGNFSFSGDEDVRDLRNLLARMKQEHFRAGGPFEGCIDLARVAVAGHSAGGAASFRVLGDDGIVAALAHAIGDAALPNPAPDKPVFLMAGTLDRIVPLASVEKAFDALPSSWKGFASFENAGHVTFTDICEIGADQGGILQIAKSFGIDVADIVIQLGSDGCGPGYVDPEAAWPAIQHLSTAWLRHALGVDGVPQGLDATTIQCFAEAIATFEYRLP